MWVERIAARRPQAGRRQLQMASGPAGIRWRSHTTITGRATHETTRTTIRHPEHHDRLGRHVERRSQNHDPGRRSNRRGLVHGSDTPSCDIDDRGGSNLRPEAGIGTSTRHDPPPPTATRRPVAPQRQHQRWNGSASRCDHTRSSTPTPQRGHPTGAEARLHSSKRARVVLRISVSRRCRLGGGWGGFPVLATEKPLPIQLGAKITRAHDAGAFGGNPQAQALTQARSHRYRLTQVSHTGVAPFGKRCLSLWRQAV